MGQSYRLICKACSHEFLYSEGGGFSFHLLHCEACGREKSVGDDEMGDAFMKGARSWVEKNVAPCSCGGRFTLDAKTRCPKCRGTDFDRDSDGHVCLYD